MAADPNTLTPEEESAGFKLLFDGCSLEQFRGFRKEQVPHNWQVRDGTILLTGPGVGDIISKATFADFELRFEFQIAKDGNSGVMWRVTEEGKHTYESGPEFQILDSHGSIGYPHERAKGNVSGALYDLIPATPEVFHGPDRWNQGGIRVVGSRITLTLNGHLTADVDTASPEWMEILGKSKFAIWPLFNKSHSGHIALQDHNDIVGFRSLRIREL
jgi:hypothetical protein